VEFVYTINGGPEQTVSADPFGRVIEWTPAEAGTYTLVVQSRNADGGLSDPRAYTFSVAAA
jgi:hypothetical protein